MAPSVPAIYCRPSNHVGHGRSAPRIVAAEGPQRLARLRIDRREISTGLAMEYQSARGGEHAGIVGLLRAGQELLPDDIAGLDIQGAHITRTEIGWDQDCCPKMRPILR